MGMNKEISWCLTLMMKKYNDKECTVLIRLILFHLNLGTIVPCFPQRSQWRQRAGNLLSISELVNFRVVKGAQI